MSIRGHKSLGSWAAVFTFVGLCCAGLSASLEARVVTTQQLQVLVKIAGITAQNGDPDSAFFANTGAGIRYNFLDSLHFPPEPPTFSEDSSILRARSVCLNRIMAERQSCLECRQQHRPMALCRIQVYRLFGRESPAKRHGTRRGQLYVCPERASIEGQQRLFQGVVRIGIERAEVSPVQQPHGPGGTGSNEGAGGVLSVELYIDSVFRNILEVITFDRPIQYDVP